MELKLREFIKRSVELNLLIVPYGIETAVFSSQDSQVLLLLIVPYGIETVFLLLKAR